MIILHLSDIHFGRNYPEYEVDGVFDKKEIILTELIESIAACELKPEHIIFTGDIAWKGKKKDFEEAREWFDKLLNSMMLGSKLSCCDSRLPLVP